MTDEGVKNQQKPQPKKSFFGRLKRLFSKKWVIALLLVILLAAGVAVGLMVSGVFNKKSEPTPTVVQPKESTETDELNRLLASGDAEGVAKKISADSTLANSLDGQLALAAAAVNDGKMDDALKIYLAAGDKYGWRADTASQVAWIYAAKGDKKQAISYYEKAKTLVDRSDNNPSRDSEVEAIDAAIKALQ